MGWAATLTYVALMVAVHDAVTVGVAPSTSCAHCTRLAGERSVRKLAVPLSAARVRAMRPELKQYTQRDAESVLFQLRFTAVDGRVSEVYRKTI